MYSSTLEQLISMSFSVQSVIRRYHEYKDTWVAVIGEEFSCQREPMNREDRFAVAVEKDSSIVGHIPRKISAICSLFLRQSGKLRYWAKTVLQ